MKRLFIWAIAALLSVGAQAVPARRDSRTVRNSDGTVLTISLRGDEAFHYHVTSDGTPVRKDAKGDWVPDTRDVVRLSSEATERRNAHRHALALNTRRLMKAPHRAGTSAATDVKKRGLLILVNFTDEQFSNTAERCQAIYSQMLNGIGTPYGKNFGSVREYFRAQSYGQFDIEFDIEGPVTVSKNMAYYGGNDASGDDKAPAKMVAEAIALVDDKVDFKNYDWDGDGEVENIYVLYAGYSEASGADENTIWPHQWQLSDAGVGRVKVDGVTVDTYACGSELLGTSGKTLDGIGTMCHEYSHCLGLPDFYDSAGKNFGMGEWSIMDYGCYNNNGFCPAAYTAYERWFSGWLEPVELTEGTVVTDMPCIEENPVAYVVYNDRNHNEYYLLENHQKVGWNKYASGHGMLVVHVDYDQNAWYNNVVNNTASRQRMTIIPADNKLTSATLSGDPYPNGGRNTALTDASKPAATLYRANTDGAKLMHKPIEKITESGGLVGFTFMGGASALDVPEPVTDESLMALTSTGFLASWGDVDGALGYKLRWAEVDDDDSGEDPADRIMLYEDFEKLIAESDGTKDLGSSLDNYMSTPGWTGQAVYKGMYGAKLATTEIPGSLTTPLLKGDSGTMTLLVDCSHYKNDSAKPTFSFLDKNDNEVSSFEFEPDDEFILWYEFEEGVPEDVKLRISTTAGKRVYVGGLFAFDAILTEDEVNDFLEKAFGESEAPKHVKRQRLACAPRRAEPVYNLISSITNASYTFEGLTPGKTYSWQVQAFGDEGVFSEWSPLVTVKLPLNEDVDGLRELPVRDGTPAGATIVDLAGRSIDASRPLRRGLYVVGGKKMVVR